MQIKYFYCFCIRLSRAHFSIIMTLAAGATVFYLSELNYACDLP